MTSIFKRKKSKNEIEEVVVEKVVVIDEPVQQQQQQKQQQQQQQQQSATPDKKKSGKSFKLLFSLSRSAKKCDEADFSHSDDVNKTLAYRTKEEPMGKKNKGKSASTTGSDVINTTDKIK